MKQTLPTSALEIAQALITLDTTEQAGIDQALTWLRQWAEEQRLVITTFPGTKALLLQTQPQEKKHFCFVTHIDVVPASGWSTAFQPEVQAGKLIGRGAVDDKGPLAICLETLLRVRDLLNLNVSCLIITDEEIENTEIRTIVQNTSFQPDFCLVADGGMHTIVDAGQKGNIRVSLETTTEGGHSAFEEGHLSAALQLFAFIEELRAHAKTQKSDDAFQPTFINISAFHTESVPYGLPSLAQAQLEIQFPPPQNVAHWTEFVTKRAKKFSTKVTFHWSCEPHSVIGTSVIKLFDAFPEISCITTGGVNLAKDLTLAGIPAVSHCPIDEYNAHCDGEHIGLDDLKKGVHTYTKLVTVFAKTAEIV
jgi:acetylornithine deacetylase/succinyl-diaminopimelate desuccinylase-like protein